jgi:hypothetical protein
MGSSSARQAASGFVRTPPLVPKRTHIFASVLVAAFALLLASCGGGGSTTPTTSGTANVRFINGSPDAGAFDVLLNGKVIASNVAYGQITSYQPITVGTSPLPQMAFVKTGTQTNIFPPLAGGAAQTFQLGAGAGAKLTIVIEGEASFIGSRGLTLGAFIEPTIANNPGTYSIVFHHASPLASLAAPGGLYVGDILFGSSNTFVVEGTMTFNSTSGNSQSLTGLSNQGAVIGPPGIGFYVGPAPVASATPVPVSPTPSPTATVTTTPAPVPSPTIYAAIMPGPAVAQSAIETNPAISFPVTGVDSANINQSLPFNTDTNLFIYVIDSTTTPSGVELIGTFNN